MKRERKRKILGAMIGIIAFIAVIAGATYAWLTWRSNNTIINGTTGCFTIDYTKGADITGTLKLKNLQLSSVSVGSAFTYDSATMASTTVQMGVNSACSIQGTGTITLNTTSIDADLVTGDSIGALNYVVVNTSDTVLAKGTVTATANNSQVLYTGFNLSMGTKTSYKVILWIDGNKANAGAIGGSYQGNISASANQVQA